MTNSKQDRHLISIVVPIFNESLIIPELYQRLKKTFELDFKSFDYELILVDDGSKDNSVKILEKLARSDPKIKMIEFSRNFGHHLAITAGLDASNGDYVVMMDGDLQDKPEEIITLYKKMQEGFDVVYAIRKEKKHDAKKKFLSRLFNLFISFMIQEEIVINSTIFRMMKKDVANTLRECRETNRYLVGLIGWVGFKHVGVEVVHGKRFAGETKYTLRKQFKLALNAIFSFSDYPLRIAGRIGSLFVIASMLFSLVIIYMKLVYNTPLMGWTSLFVAVMFMGGIQLFTLHVIGEYLGRTYIEVKQRPLYVIKRKIN